MYQTPDPKPDFSAIDEKITQWWRENSIFEKSIKQREGSDLYVFYDGPPFMSGIPHYATLLSSMPKDAIPRYQTMKGKKVERLWGWDCHGLPIENKVEEELKLNGRQQILDYGLKPFIEKCYEWNRVGIDNWRWYIEKIGRWADLDNAYRTMDQDFMESVWWSFKQIWDKELIYKGRRTSLFSTDSSTPVSSFEVSMDPDNYRDTEDIAITVKFELTPESRTKLNSSYEKVYMLAWTTTPWTIPSNFALAVNPEAEYVGIEYQNELMILAKSRVEAVFTGLESEPKQVAEFKPAQLEGLKYQQIYDYLTGNSNDFQVYLSDYVTTEDGTGVLHIAPAFGEADFEMGQQFGLSFSSDIDDAGKLLVGPWKGTYLRAANPLVTADLQSRGNLLKEEKYVHRLPYYRYKNPLIYKTEENYFVNVQKLKDQLISSNEDINWIPEYFKDGRFKHILETAPDWSISRSRFWGTAMPVWLSESGKEIVVGSRDELMTYVNASDNGSRIQKVTIALGENTNADSELESFVKSNDNTLNISASQTILSELRSKYLGETEAESKVKPVKEGEQRAYYLFNGQPLDMHRPFIDDVKFTVDGELYTRTEYTVDVWMDSGAMPFAQFHYPFEHKDKFEQNFPGDFISEYTGQIRAWFYVLHLLSNALFDRPAFKNVLVTGVLAGNDGRKMSKSFKNYPDPKATLERYGADSLRLYFLGSPIMNGNDMNFSEEELQMQVREMLIPLWNVYKYYVIYANMHQWQPASLVDKSKVVGELDKWLIVRVDQTVAKVTESMDAYELPRAIREIKALVDDTSKWYIRRSRDRFADGDTAVLENLFYSLYTTLKLLAPIAPFTPEYIYKEIHQGVDDAESVHLTAYPEIDQKFLDENAGLIPQMSVVRSIAELGNSIRTTNALKVRQPLAELLIDSKEPIAEWMRELLADELNVKAAKQTTVSEQPNYIVNEDSNLGVKIALSTLITPELKAEGLMRELVRNIQSTRKEMHLEAGTAINLTYATSSDELLGIFATFADEIKSGATINEMTQGELLAGEPNVYSINVESTVVLLSIAQ